MQPEDFDRQARKLQSTKYSLPQLRDTVQVDIKDLTHKRLELCNLHPGGRDPDAMQEQMRER